MTQPEGKVRVVSTGRVTLRGSSHYITGGSHYITGGSHYITGGSHYITGGSHYITGGGQGGDPVQEALYTFDFIANEIITPAGAFGAEPVTIFIVDEFPTDAAELLSMPSATLEADIRANLPAEIEPASQKAIDFFVSSLNTAPHGLLVLAHFEKLLTALGFTQSSELGPVGASIWLGPIESGARITLQPVPISFDAPEQLFTALSNLVAASGQRAVVNMSFTIMPDTVLYQAAEASGSDYFYALLTNDTDENVQLAALNAWLSAFVGQQRLARTLPEVAGVLAELLDGSSAPASLVANTLFKRLLASEYPAWLARLAATRLASAQKQVAWVAASGNVGESIRFPLLPGAFSEVINVAANAPYSVPGEVAMPGGWFPFTSAPDIAYQGTSFAAPIVSLIAAASLSQPEPDALFASAVQPMGVLSSYPGSLPTLAGWRALLADADRGLVVRMLASALVAVSEVDGGVPVVCHIDGGGAVNLTLQATGRVQGGDGAWGFNGDDLVIDLPGGAGVFAARSVAGGDLPLAFNGVAYPGQI